MPEERFLSVVSGGRRIGFPLVALRAIRPWEEPVALPGGALWLRGVLPGEGEALPVLSETVWGGEQGAPEVNLFLDLGGRALAIPGRAPAALSGVPAPLPEGAVGACFSGILSGGGSDVYLVDVAALYSALGLVYNEVRLG